MKRKFVLLLVLALCGCGNSGSGDEISNSDDITVTAVPIVNTPPTASISLPGDGTSVVNGTPITFTGSATDTEDGDITASLAWTSSLDGSIGSGASFSLTTLSVGTHIITLYGHCGANR